MAFVDEQPKLLEEPSEVKETLVRITLANETPVH